MNEELLREGLSKILQLVKDTGDFVLAEASEVVRQLMLYHMITDKILVVGSIAVLISATVYYNKKKHRLAEMWAKGDDTGPLTYLGLAAACISSIVSLFTYGAELIKLLIAPKVWLIEYISKLI